MYNVKGFFFRYGDKIEFCHRHKLGKEKGVRFYFSYTVKSINIQIYLLWKINPAAFPACLILEYPLILKMQILPLWVQAGIL